MIAECIEYTKTIPKSYGFCVFGQNHGDSNKNGFKNGFGRVSASALATFGTTWGPIATKLRPNWAKAGQGGTKLDQFGRKRSRIFDMMVENGSQHVEHPPR